MRIKRLLGYEEAPGIPQFAEMMLLAVVMLAAAFGIEASLTQQAATNRAVEYPIAGNCRSVPVAYQKWADEDVVWIITPEERARFMSLTSDAERNQFIRQFWQRRDVEASSNGKADFRKTYYQRIAYANEHFKATGTPGWKTARDESTLCMDRQIPLMRISLLLALRSLTNSGTIA